MFKSKKGQSAKKGKKSTKSDLLSDAKKLDVIWHDIKKFPAIVRGYVDNIEHEAYGKVPSKLNEPLLDLNALSVAFLVYVENVMALTKLETNTFKIETDKLDLNSIIENAMLLCQPVKLERKKNVKYDATSGKNKIKANQRYSELIISNMMALAAHTPPEMKDFNLSVEKDKGFIQIELRSLQPSKNTINKPANVFDKDNLFLTSKDLLSKFSLHIFVAKKLAEKQKGQFDLTVDDNYLITTLKLPRV